MGTGMRASDAFSWSMERDAEPAQHDRRDRLAGAQSRLAGAVRAGPTPRPERCRASAQCVVPPGRPFARPAWTDDAQFDLGWHLRRVDAPAPHTPDTVLTIARNGLMAAFDPVRPLWEFTLVEGLVGGRAALVMKVHHALTDGIGGIELAMHLFDLGRAARHRRTRDRRRPGTGRAPERPGVGGRRGAPPGVDAGRRRRDGALDRPHRRPGQPDALADHAGTQREQESRRTRAAARRPQAGRRPRPTAASTTASWPRSQAVSPAITSGSAPPSTSSGSRCRSASASPTTRPVATASR